ncbi:MAG: alpha-1,2-fucosyltransferase [Bacteroidota bacterium]|nr:alpha-1,2-fucosyltransferase [Bacteroidota bacterium]
MVYNNYNVLKGRKIIIKLKGGLGNQMFQYAFHIFLISKNCNAKFRISKNPNNFHNGIELEKAFGITLPRTTIIELFKLKIDSFLLKFFQASLFFNRIIESDDNCESTQIIDEISKNKNNYLDGYFQNESFFKPVKENILSIFKFESQLSKKQRKTYNMIQSTNSISLHVRRGDYSNHKWRYGKIASLEYYKKSIKYIRERVKDPVFFVFSDELEWCKKNLHYSSLFFVDCTDCNNSYHDMYLMSQCKHNIIANSTFSWWAAYLNPNEEKHIIRPNKFVNLDSLHPKNEIYIHNWINIK